MVCDSGLSVSSRFLFIGRVQVLKRYRRHMGWVTLLFHAEGFNFGCVPVNG